MRIQTAIAILALCCSVPLLAPAASVATDNIAYMGTVAGEFGTIDLNTGVFSILGNSGQTLAGMAVTNGLLYASSYHTAGKLYTVNPTNGSVTLVGNSTSLVYDDFGSTISGLYAIGTNAALYSINSTTGTETFIGPTGLTLGSWRFFDEFEHLVFRQRPQSLHDQSEHRYSNARRQYGRRTVQSAGRRGWPALRRRRFTDSRSCDA